MTKTRLRLVLALGELLEDAAVVLPDVVLDADALIIS